MPIYRLLKDAAFEPAIAEAASRAYENLLIDLQLADRTDPFTEIVAQHVVAVASAGVNNSAEIRQQVLILLARPGSSGH